MGGEISGLISNHENIYMIPCSVERYEDIGTETNINLSHQLYYHILGTEQEKDILCWEDPKHPKWRFQSSITDDGKVLALK